MDSIIQKNLAKELMQTMAQFKRSSGQQPTSDHRIKPSEFILLKILMDNANQSSIGMKVTDLSEKLQITPGAVTHMVNSLEKGGFIERQADQADRRIVLVSMTEKGSEVLKNLYAKHLQFLEGLVSHFGEQDSKQFIRLLSVALDYFNERGK